ncbi:hypothetical protein KHP62_09970 [Rhodobacteraceae bacterium NNCM2]|nr:hypothetical protein [Coraliihabitans acroporae]
MRVKLVKRRSRFVTRCIIWTLSLWLGAALGGVFFASEPHSEVAEIDAVAEEIADLRDQHDRLLSELATRFGASEGVDRAGLSVADALSLIVQTSKRMQVLDRELDILRQGENGFVGTRIVVVDQVSKAYALAPPRLMMSVKSLGGGPLTAYFGDQSRFMNVGQRADVMLGTQRCYLTLLDSARGQATFQFSCEETAPAGRIAETGEQRKLATRQISAEF